jgi:hypothetical protein
VSSGLYVYAITGGDAGLPDANHQSSVDELVKVRLRDLAAIASRVIDDAAPITIDAVLHHEAVVEAIRQHGSALPVRFGTVFRDESSVAAALSERYESLLADLQRLGGKVELSLTAIWAAAPTDVPSDDWRNDAGGPGRGAGATYLLERAAKVRRDDALTQRARGVAQDLDGILGWLALERRVSLLPTPKIAVRAAYLLDPAHVSAFRAAFEAIRGSRGELRVLLTGPWPPYSFVKMNEPAAAERPWRDYNKQSGGA